MRNLISCVLLLFSSVIASAEDQLTSAIAAVEADVVFMRHALAPGFGDPANFAFVMVRRKAIKDMQVVIVR